MWDGWMMYFENKSYDNTNRRRDLLPTMSFRLWSALVLILFSLISSPSLAKSLSSENCYRGHLSEELLWVTSGAAELAGDGALLVDTPRQKIVRVGPHGRVEELEIRGIPGLRPRLIRSARGGYLVLEFVDYPFRGKYVDRPRIHRIDADLNLVRTFDFKPKQVLGIYDFVEWNAGILAFGELRTDKGYWAGLFSMSEQGQVQQVRELYSPANPIMDNYAASDTIRFLAKVEGSPAKTGKTAEPPKGAAYMLALEEKPWLARIDEKTGAYEELRDLPSDLRFPNVAQVLEDSAKRAVSPLMALLNKLEQEAGSVSGLYTDKSRGLFVLARSLPGWWLIRLNPTDGTEIGRMPLPVSGAAAHLTLVPASDAGGLWTIIEKDSAQPFEFDDRVLPFLRTERLKQVPSDWIESTQSLLDEDACLFLSLP
jgi:hypothetical protein